MKCFIMHHGQNFSQSFGPFDSVDAACEWLKRPEIEKAGVRGAIYALVPPETDPAKIWDTDPWQDDPQGGSHEAV